MTQGSNTAGELAGEHDEIDRLAVRIAALGRGSERAALVHELCARFLIHTQAEERYLHPAVCRLLPDGQVTARFQAERNRAVARTIEIFERGEAEGDELDILIGHLLVGVQDHVEQQDTVLLPGLVDVCSKADVEQLGRELRDGVQTAREAAQRAGARSREQAEHAAERADGESAARTEPRCLGFRVLLQRIARPDRSPEPDRSAEFG